MLSKDDFAALHQRLRAIGAVHVRETLTMAPFAWPSCFNRPKAVQAAAWCAS
jgi:hypothetical protein